MAGKITDNYFEFGNLKYFRGNAHMLQLGSFGDKHDPIGSKSYIDSNGTVKAAYVAPIVKSNLIADIDWSQTSKASFEEGGVIKFFSINGQIDSNGTYEKGKAANLKLINFFIEEYPLKKMLNTQATTARLSLADEGSDGRVVSEVWVVMVAYLAEYFNMYGSKSLSAKVLGQQLSFSVTGEKFGTQSITLSPGTTFAYKSHKVKDWTKNKAAISNLEADYHGMS